MSLNEHKTDKIQDDFAWDEYMARHDMTWVVKPVSWDEGAFIGNGMIGAMIYGEEHRAKRHVLRLVLGRSDVTARRPNGSGFSPRVPIGEIDLELEGMIYHPTEMRLDLWNAELRASLTTTKGQVRLRVFAHSERPVIAMEIETSPGEREAQFRWYAAPEVDPVLRQADGINLNQYIPPTSVERAEDRDISLGVQTYAPEGSGGCVTAWKQTVAAPGRKIGYVSIVNGADSQSRRQAAEHVRLAAACSIEELAAAHRRWWHDYYRKSFVSIPDSRLESC